LRKKKFMMVNSSPRNTSNAADLPERGPDSLQSALNRALLFPTNRATDIMFGPAQIREWAHEEASFGRVVVDYRGLTAGMTLNILQPARALFSEWRQVRSNFNTLIEPLMGRIEAVTVMEREIVDLERRRVADIEQIERVLQSDQRFIEAKQEYQRAERRLDDIRTRSGNRTANMTSHSYMYPLLLLLVGCVEWLINFQTFELFVEVPAIAAGWTILCGFLLAVAAHGHGTVLKQWTHLLGAHRSRIQRATTYRLIASSTLWLLIVLLSAGGSRYAATLRMQPKDIIIGVDIASNPLRDVLISMLSNIAAWAAGVAIAYLCHDADPEFIDATKQFRTASKNYHARRRPVIGDIRDIEGRYSQEIRDKQTEARVRSVEVEAERAMLMQIDTHEKSILNGIGAALRVNFETYRDHLAQIAAKEKGPLVFTRGGPDGSVVSIYEYKSFAYDFDHVGVEELIK
jgi:hypothetical protein